MGVQQERRGFSPARGTGKRGRLNMEVYKSKLKDSLGIEVYKRESQHLLYLSKRELKVIDEPFTESEINFCVQRSRLLLLLTHEVI